MQHKHEIYINNCITEESKDNLTESTTKTRRSHYNQLHSRKDMERTVIEFIFTIELTTNVPEVSNKHLRGVLTHY